MSFVERFELLAAIRHNGASRVKSPNIFVQSSATYIDIPIFAPAVEGCRQPFHDHDKSSTGSEHNEEL